jgi:hypothetical protein
MLEFYSIDEATKELQRWTNKKHVLGSFYHKDDPPDKYVYWSQAAFCLVSSAAYYYVNTYNLIERAKSQEGIDDVSWGALIKIFWDYGSIAAGAVTFNPLLFGRGLWGIGKSLEDDHKKIVDFLARLSSSNPHIGSFIEFKTACEKFTAKHEFAGFFTDCETMGGPELVLQQPSSGRVTFRAGLHPPPDVSV